MKINQDLSFGILDDSQESLEEWMTDVLVECFFGYMNSHAIETESSERFLEIRALVRIIQSDENILYGCTGECTEDKLRHATWDVHGIELPALAE